MFYKDNINEEEHYAMVKGYKVYFGLEVNEIGHAIFKDPKKRDLDDM